jgi:hypothetical protein
VVVIDTSCPSPPSNTLNYTGISLTPVITLLNDTLYSSINTGN